MLDKDYYSRDIIQKYSKPVPRYTSYPTAPNFNTSVGHEAVSQWMDQIPSDTSISIYIHIPFCDRLCWFCGCHTKHTLKYDPVKKYMSNLLHEIKTVRSCLGRSLNIAHIHLGGGSPSMLKAPELYALRQTLDDCFQIDARSEISVEFDPNDLRPEALKSFAEFGVTRASIGVQDFDETVQSAINRPQTFSQTASIIEGLRKFGVKSLNIDALYGLPYQNLETVKATFEQLSRLEPDRVALFGYAHVPWLKPHQRLIPDESLPDIYDRFWQARLAQQMMLEADYMPIGMDHFAKPTDSLATAYAKGDVHRNFQGYTSDDCPILIGFGTSAISKFKGGYAQNVKDVHSYNRCLAKNELPIDRGLRFTSADLVHGAAIEELMTYFSLNSAALVEAFGERANSILDTAREIAHADMDGVFVKTSGGFKVTSQGRPFIRSIAAKFDPYLGQRDIRYSQAI